MAYWYTIASRIVDLMEGPSHGSDGVKSRHVCFWGFQILCEVNLKTYLTWGSPNIYTETDS